MKYARIEFERSVSCEVFISFPDEWTEDQVLHLMAGPPHIGRDCAAQQEASVTSVYLAHFGGGAW